MTMTAPTDQQVSPIPEGFHTITPSIVVDGAAAAIEFYKQAFGAQEIDRAPAPDGTKIFHATLQIGTSRFMLNDQFPDMGCLGPAAIGGSPTSMHLYVDDADAVFEQAIAAGATVTMPIDDVFWGDRYGRLKDPFGHEWAIATRKRNLTLDEMMQGMESCSG